MKHFRQMLEARHFVILTDYKPLTYAFSQKRDKCSPRFNQFTTDICHISGQDNVVADGWSRVEAVCTSVSPKPWTKRRQQTRNSPTFFKGPLLPVGEVPGSRLGHISTMRHVFNQTTPYVPETLRRQVFYSLHGLGYLGTRATAKLIS